MLLHTYLKLNCVHQFDVTDGPTHIQNLPQRARERTVQLKITFNCGMPDYFFTVCRTGHIYACSASSLSFWSALCWFIKSDNHTIAAHTVQLKGKHNIHEVHTQRKCFVSAMQHLCTWRLTGMYIAHQKPVHNFIACRFYLWCHINILRYVELSNLLAVMFFNLLYLALID